MKIVELGHTGVGKTTYMASMYGALQKGIEGFTLRASDKSDHTRLLELAKSIQRGKYPSPTDQRSEYNFYLQYQGKDVFHFNWADYRGGALREKQDSEQTQLLIRDLREADGIMMFCDCQALARGDSRTNQIGRIASFINNAINQGLDHPISLAIVLTKADLVEDIDESILSPLKGLIESIKVSELVQGAILPVACGIEPTNVEVPVLFALHVGVYLKAVYLAKEIEDHQKMAEYYEEQTKGIGGFLKELWDEFQGNITYRDLARSRMEKAIEKYKQYEIIIEPTQALSKYIYGEG
ncbi:hypothetical protein PCC9214_05803 [Planktothrix tepida]|uniref:Double-GTPase 2 domain-containing protein n=1 Tax=Planktothrix tepida PCC 9214 TaxID=671072 RepID=A0A1J1LS34_9CYAN|nr:hypothetical protein [Planktothrix tepida]CAD5990465.1 hypothetical protein PCC9214_05803 [Planktothrix tepida]CUR35397.1 conserved hypothetical protein [Planktothrix tepida PCC 9214]